MNLNIISYISSFFTPIEKEYYDPSGNKQKEKIEKRNITSKDIFWGFDTNGKPVIFHNDILNQHIFILGENNIKPIKSLFYHTLKNNEANLFMLPLNDIDIAHFITISQTMQQHHKLRLFSIKNRNGCEKLPPISFDILCKAIPQVDFIFNSNIFGEFKKIVLNNSYISQKDMTYLLSIMETEKEKIQTSKICPFHKDMNFSYIEKRIDGYDRNIAEFQNTLICQNIYTQIHSVIKIFKLMYSDNINWQIITNNQQECSYSWMILFKNFNNIFIVNKTEEDQIIGGLITYIFYYNIANYLLLSKNKVIDNDFFIQKNDNSFITSKKENIVLNCFIDPFFCLYTVNFGILAAQARALGLHMIYCTDTLETNKNIESMVVNTNTKISTGNKQDFELDYYTICSMDKAFQIRYDYEGINTNRNINASNCFYL